MVIAGTELGRPALMAAWRAGFWPQPAVSTWPRMTSPTCSPAIPVSSIRALITAVPSWSARRLDKPPPKLPTAVRFAATITTSRMGNLRCSGQARNRPASYGIDGGHCSGKAPGRQSHHGRGGRGGRGVAVGSLHVQAAAAVNADDLAGDEGRVAHQPGDSAGDIRRVAGAGEWGLVQNGFLVLRVNSDIAFRPENGAGRHAVYPDIRCQVFCPGAGKGGQAGFAGAVQRMVLEWLFAVDIDQVDHRAGAVLQSRQAVLEQEERGFEVGAHNRLPVIFGGSLGRVGVGSGRVV